eukprot:g14851.t1
MNTEPIAPKIFSKALRPAPSATTTTSGKTPTTPNRTVGKTPPTTNSGTVVVMAIQRRKAILKHTLAGFAGLSEKPDEIVFYKDFDALDDIEEAARKIDVGVPVSFHTRPGHDKWKYDTNFRFGRLRSFWWWLMNHAWREKHPEQICYFEDDMYPHRDFFKWLREARKVAVKNIHWGILATSGGMYTPMCISKAEWVSLVLNYEQFCFTDNWAWDMVLFRLQQHGPLPGKRLEASNAVAVHIGYSNADTKEKRDSLIAELNKHEVLGGEVAFARKPVYGGKDFPKEFIDLNNRPPFVANDKISIRKVFNIIQNCVSDAQPSRRFFVPQVSLNASYETFIGIDIKGNDIMQLVGKSVMQVENICSDLPDCMGFVLLDNGDCWLKRTVEDSTRIKVNTTYPKLYIKSCSRKTAMGCTRSYKLEGG